MAHNLKLGIYQFSLRYQSQRNSLKIDEAFDQIVKNESNKKEKFQKIVKTYIQSFDGQFAKSEDKTKSIIPLEVDFNSGENIIHGSIKGGLTEIEREIYKGNDASKPIGKINKDDITTLPYYFLIWTPVDLDFGILMVQYYSSTSINSPFIHNLQSFFRKYSLTFRTFPYVPEKYKKEFIKGSHIKKIALINRKVQKDVRSKFNPLISEDEDFDIVLELRRLNKNPENFKETIKKAVEKTKKIFKADLNVIGMNNEDDYEMRIYYENENGKKSYAKLTNNFDILPTIDLPNELKIKGKDAPDMKKIDEHCKNILKGLKTEILKDE